MSAFERTERGKRFCRQCLDGDTWQMFDGPEALCSCGCHDRNPRFRSSDRRACAIRERERRARSVDEICRRVADGRDPTTGGVPPSVLHLEDQ